jgi:hypothetical protein
MRPWEIPHKGGSTPLRRNHWYLLFYSPNNAGSREEFPRFSRTVDISLYSLSTFNFERPLKRCRNSKPLIRWNCHPHLERGSFTGKTIESYSYMGHTLLSKVFALGNLFSYRHSGCSRPLIIRRASMRFLPAGVLLKFSSQRSIDTSFLRAGYHTRQKSIFPTQSPRIT